MERMRRLLVNCKIKHVRIPELRLLPTERVLVMEYIDAAHID